MPAGSDSMRNRVLVTQHAQAHQLLLERIQEEEDITVNLDMWTNAAKRSVVACNLSFTDGTTLMLEAKDVSDDSHTADFIAGERLVSCLR